MEKDIQLFILKGLFENISYFRNVLVNLDPIFFDEDKGPIIQFIRDYYSKYEKIPEYSVCVNELSNRKDIYNELRSEIEAVIKKVKNLDFDSEQEGSWLFDATKSFVNERSMFLVLKEGAMEINKDSTDRDYGKIERKMREALSMDWNEDLGLDYFDEAEIDSVYDSLSDISIRIPIGVDVIDDAINGGIPGKTKFCMVYVGQSGVGKCGSYINTIKVRNKLTGEIKILPIGKFHDSIKGEHNVNEERKQR